MKNLMNVTLALTFLTLFSCAHHGTKKGECCKKPKEGKCEKDKKCEGSCDKKKEEMKGKKKQEA